MEEEKEISQLPPTAVDQAQTIDEESLNIVVETEPKVQTAEDLMIEEYLREE